MNTRQKALLAGTITALIAFSVIFFALTASQNTAKDSKVPVVEKYYQNLSVSAPRQVVIASQPFKITNEVWAYLTYSGPVGTDLNKLKFFTTLYAPTNQLAVGDTVKAVKFHGNDSYGYFYVK